MREIDGVGRALDILQRYYCELSNKPCTDNDVIWAVEKAVEVMEVYLDEQ